MNHRHSALSSGGNVHSPCRQILHRFDSAVITSISYWKSKGSKMPLPDGEKKKKKSWRTFPKCEIMPRWAWQRRFLAPVSVATCLSGDSARCDEAWAEMIMQEARELILWLTYSSASPPPSHPTEPPHSSSSPTLRENWHLGLNQSLLPLDDDLH